MTSSDLLGVDCWQELRERLAHANGEVQQHDVEHDCERVLLYSRHHWLEYDGVGHDRQSFKAMVAAAMARPAAHWNAVESELVFLLYVLGSANLGLEQVDRVLSRSSVSDAIGVRRRMYLEALENNGGHARQLGGDVSFVERARELCGLRKAVEKRNYRYSVIDGDRWFRTERLISHASIDLDDVPEELWSELEGAPGGRDALRQLCVAHIERHETPEDTIAKMMRFAVADPVLKIDHITLTAPRQLGSQIHQDLHRRENIFYRTEMRSGLQLEDFASQLGHESAERMTRVIAARMQVLKLKAAKQFFGSGCLGGEVLEKSGDYMVFYNEDAHYPGHQNAGCSTGGRSPIPLVFRREGKELCLPGIFADLRAVRLSHDESDRFMEPQLARVIQYAAWIGAILMTAYESGVAITDGS
jgi:hypothetical protein